LFNVKKPLHYVAAFLINIKNMCQNNQAGWSELIELRVDSTSNTITFPQNLSIVENDVEVLAIETYTSDQVAKAPSGRDVISSSEAKNCFLHVREKKTGSYKLNYIPFSDLIPANNAGNKEYLKPFEADFSQSDVVVSQGATLTTGRSILVRVIYRKKENC
jgi:hypothetical protein